MKNTKIFIASLLAVFAVTSCNLEEMPDTAINTSEAMESVADCQAFRNGLYSGMKTVFTGNYVYAQDLQTDLYHALKGFGNWGGPFYHYSLTPSEGTAESVWYSLYNCIGNANFLIAGTQKLLDAGTLSKDDEALVKQYNGEAHYIRAHMYFNLSQYFCVDYDPGTAEDEMGVPVVTVYEPTPNADKYPARASLADTYLRITEDLTIAEKEVTAEGTVNSAYVTADVVAALQARVALTMHDYDTAFTKAKGLIDGEKYELMSDRAKYANGWVNDNLTEAIWQIAMLDPTDAGSGDNYFIYNTSGEDGKDNPQYIPEDWALALYDQANDIRFSSYFSKRDFTTPTVGTAFLMVKYPGNPKLYSEVTSYKNQPKVFRISEMYLIAAEASANRTGQDGVASFYLNELRSKRISNWENKDYSGNDLMREIREERVRELFGEGFRLNDLKRWHMGFSRSAGQDPNIVYAGANYASFSASADDPRFVWPIPKREMNANPQMVQNPAYTM
jgi:hypothetical protein